MNKILVGFLLCFSTSAFSAPAAEAIDTAIRAQLAEKLPDAKVESVGTTKISGVYEVVIEGTIFYMSGDGRYYLAGDMTDLKTGENLTEGIRSVSRLKLLKTVAETQMIHFDSEKPKYQVTVFTDIDCGYCRKLHGEMAGYNELGIDIQYLFYPRSGLTGDSYNKAVSVWCADDRKKAMTDAKQGQTLESKTCDNPVADHFELGQKIGLRGTPAMVFENGIMIPGYVPPKKLLQALTEELGSR